MNKGSVRYRFKFKKYVNWFEEVKIINKVNRIFLKGDLRWRVKNVIEC